MEATNRYINPKAIEFMNPLRTRDMAKGMVPRLPMRRVTLKSATLYTCYSSSLSLSDLQVCREGFKIILSSLLT